MRTNTIGPLGLLTLAVLVASTWLLDVLATVFPEQSAFLWIARQQGLNLSGLLSIVFMSLTMLYHWVGIWDSGRIIFFVFIIVCFYYIVIFNITWELRKKRCLLGKQRF